jgi:hypothetical protein
MKKTNHEKKNNNLCKSVLAVVAIMALTLPSVAIAQEFTVEKKDAAYNELDYSPFMDQHFPTRVLWGDTHLHTANSFDAGFVGTKLGPDEAYCFARGEEVTASNGMRAKIGVTYSTVNRWENGKGKPSPLAILRIERLQKK